MIALEICLEAEPWCIRLLAGAIWCLRTVLAGLFAALAYLLSAVVVLLRALQSSIDPEYRHFEDSLASNSADQFFAWHFVASPTTQPADLAWVASLTHLPT